jgi:hypothetical protein
MTEAPPLLLLAVIVLIIVGSIAAAGLLARTLEDHLKEKDK